MTGNAFKRWNWEYDIGEQALPDGCSIPSEYAIAYYDYKRRLYRVVSRVKWSPDRPEDGSSAYHTSVYDYFCDEDGRILQKRSMDDENENGVIVDLEYDDEKGEVTETAWSPIHGLGEKHTRKQE